MNQKQPRDVWILNVSNTFFIKVFDDCKELLIVIYCFKLFVINSLWVRFLIVFVLCEKRFSSKSSGMNQFFWKQVTIYDHITGPLLL